MRTRALARDWSLDILGNSWSIAIASMPSTSSFVRGDVVEAKRESEFPSSAEEGWLRPQIKCCEAIFEGADGVVLVQKISGCLNQPPRPRLSKEREQFLMARPPLLRQGGEFFAQPRNMTKLQTRAKARAALDATSQRQHMQSISGLHNTPAYRSG